MSEARFNQLGRERSHLDNSELLRGATVVEDSRVPARVESALSQMRSAHELADEKALELARQNERLLALQAELDRLRTIESSTIWQATAVLRAAAERIPKPVRRNLLRVARILYWAITPHRIPARLKFLREHTPSIRAPSALKPDDAAVDEAPCQSATPSRAELFLQYEPLISILLPVFDTEPCVLTSAVASVRNQTYHYWELCVWDDSSRRSDTVRTLHELTAADPRIRMARSEDNRGIAAASNAALAMARGEFIAMLDHDDTLAPDALLRYVRCLNERPNIDVLYSDEDKIDIEGRPSEPFYKPDWSPILFCGVMYIGHFLMVRRSIAELVGADQ